jgi:predicted secreted hydrolase
VAARLIRRLALVLLVAGCDAEVTHSPDITGGAATRFLSGDDNDGYARVLEVREFEFPRDHGSHPDYRSEWWYFTGNLNGESGNRFGFELTFFRFALTPRRGDRESPWGANQAWMAHLALTDGSERRFVAAERFSRGALGLAGSTSAPFSLHLEDWSVASSGPKFSPLTLNAATDEGEIHLTLTALKDVVRNGASGVDKKGPEDGNASYYYAITRLDVTGEIRVRQHEEQVTGLAWMDREWGTSALSRDLEGWDWFALQLSDGRDLMYYQLRGVDGEASPYSVGTLVNADGSSRTLQPADVELRALDHWQSPNTGATYPVSWMLRVPSEGLNLEIQPLIQAQELDLTVRYWEGSVTASGTGDSDGVSGRGYLELTGY